MYHYLFSDDGPSIPNTRSQAIAPSLSHPTSHDAHMIPGLTEEEPIAIQIKRRKWRWIGHTLRKPPEAIEKQALEWNPQGAPKVGRPRGTWRKTINEEMEQCGKVWWEAKAIVTNRVRWKVLTEALCSTRE